MARTSYAIALGSNRRHGGNGGPEAVLAAAVAALADAGLRIEARAPVLRSAAIGPAGRAFANGAVLAGREADDAQPALGIAERGDGGVPPVGMLGAQLFTKADEAWAARAIVRGFGGGQRAGCESHAPSLG